MDREHLRNSILVLRDSIPPGEDKGLHSNLLSIILYTNEASNILYTKYHAKNSRYKIALQEGVRECNDLPQPPKAKI